MGTQDDYNALMRKYKSLGERVTYLETEGKRKDAAIDLLIREKTQWVASKQSWETIMQQTLANSNQNTQQVNVEIDRLKKENTEHKSDLKILRGEHPCPSK